MERTPHEGRCDFLREIHIGTSGANKTYVMRTISRFLDLAETPLRERRILARSFGLINKEPMTPEEIAMETFYEYSLSGYEVEKAVEEALNRLRDTVRKYMDAK
ncbi:MAG TPA: hypothetical protein VJJ22_05345 [Candidatus Paceibacterota bacterium]